jgi:mannose-6-phosphate isomerase-like protein (cupin superfamily)
MKTLHLATLTFVGTLLGVLTPIVHHAETTMATPSAKVIPLRSSGKEVTPVIGGPPDSVTMKSGYVVLPPGKSVGKHSTEQNEELLVVFEGQGEMTFKDGSKLPVVANTALYCPPRTEHNVTNTGAGILRYVYVVAHAR